MIDRYWWGEVTRISPEAPVPVVKLTGSSMAAGGAANVAANIAGLGASATLAGIVGDDGEGDDLPSMLENIGVARSYLSTIPGRRTTVKTRVIAHGQQIARVDSESEQELTDAESTAPADRVVQLIEDADIVLLSDYAKGFLTPLLISRVLAQADLSGKKVLVDPKGRDYSRYDGASLITPNKKEAGDAVNLDQNDPKLVEHAGDKLMSNFNFGRLLITQGEAGMSLFVKGEDEFHLPTNAREVYDVTGAGDTVIATLAVALGAGYDLRQAAKMANTAAGIVVAQIGTTAIKAAELEAAMDND